jgi:rhamnogalacturonyl hydrolase YesR
MTSRDDALEVIRWHEQFGDPNGPEYLSLDEINNGMELIDMLRARVPDEEKVTEVLRILGFHPPSTVRYAAEHTRPYMVDAHGHSAAWLDGLACGAAIYCLLAATCPTRD